MGFILGLGIFVIMALIVTFITILIYCLSEDNKNNYIEGSIIVAMGIIIFIISITLGYFIDSPEKFGYQKIEEKVIEEAEEK